MVTNTPGVLTQTTADLTWALILSVARRIPQADKFTRAKNYIGWELDLFLGKEITGKCLGIIGMGRVGRAFAAKARGFDMEIHYHNRSRLSPETECGATFHEDIGSLLKVSDFLSLHCPATPETIDLMNADRFALLPDGAVVVNSARGALVDEDALIAAIRSGKLSAAGLDCFKVEPGGNPAFADHENIFMLPHIGSATKRTRDAMGFRALDNLDAFFAGRTPRDKL